MKKKSNVKSLKKSSSTIELPIVNLPFLENVKKLKIEKRKLLGLMRYFSRNGRYPLPNRILTNGEINTFLKQNPTLVVRIRREVLSQMDCTPNKIAA